LVDEHGHEPPARATGTLNSPGRSSASQPRAARRFAFDRTPSTLAGTGSSPSAAASCRQSIASPHVPLPPAKASMIRWQSGARTVGASPSASAAPPNRTLLPGPAPTLRRPSRSAARPRLCEAPPEPRPPSHGRSRTASTRPRPPAARPEGPPPAAERRVHALPTTPSPTASRHLHQRDDTTPRPCRRDTAPTPDQRKHIRHSRKDNGFSGLKRYEAENDWLTTIRLPPYAPDLNPVEAVWSLVRRATANTAFDTPDDLDRTLRRKLRRIQLRPRLIDGCLTATGLTLTPPTPH
jgi:transposase